MPREIEGEDAITTLEQMFAEYQLDEYLPAWEALKKDWERVCKDNFEFRSVKRDGKGEAA